MKNIIERIAGGAKIARYLPKAVSTRLAVAALAALAAGGAWAAAGDTVTICNDLSTGGFATSTPTYTANDSYTITIPAVSGLSAGDYVRVSSFTFGRNSVYDTMNVAYVTSKDFLGDTIRSENRTESGKFSKITAFREICAFGSAGDDNDLLLKVGTAYDFSLLNSSGAKTAQKVLAFTTTDGTYSPVAQDTTSTDTRMEQEVVCKVVSSAVVSASGTWSGLAFSNAPGDWSAATTAPVLVELTADSTLEINTDVNVESIVFAVPANVTLTLTGSKAITATTAISIKGGGSVCVAAGADVLSGPVKVASGTTFTFDFANVAAPTEENPFGDALLAACSFSVLGSAQFSNVPANTIASIGDCGIRLVHNSVFGKWNATGQSMYAWRSPGTSGNFSTRLVAPVTTSSGAVGSTEQITWSKFCSGNGSYSAPAPAFYFDSAEYSMQQTPDFSPLTIGGLLVTAGGSTITRSDGQLELGDTRSTDAKIETYFVLAQSFGLGDFGKGGSYPNKIYGTVNIEAAEGATLTLPSQGITLDTATAANLKMHGAGNIALTGTITATGNVTLDYSDVDSGNTFIRGSLTVDVSTKLVLPPGLSEGTPYTLCTGTLTAPSMVTEGSVQIGDDEATTATLLYNTTAKTVTYYTSMPEFTGTVSESTITWDSEPTQAQYAIGKIVLTGSGDVTLPYEPLAISADSGVTVNVTGYTSAALSGEGTFKYTSGYPTSVPAGMTYWYVGSDDSTQPTAIANVSVSGSLKMSGCASLTGYSQATTGSLDIVGGATSLAGSSCALHGNVTVRADATLTLGASDMPDYNGTSFNLYVYGTLNCGSTRQSINGSMALTFYTGATITGSGDGNTSGNDSTFDFFAANANTRFVLADGAESGTVNFNAPISMRGVNVTWTIDSGVTVDWAGDATKGCTSSSASNCTGALLKAGAGTLKLSGVMNKGSVTLNAGTLDVAASQTVAVTYGAASAAMTASNGAVVTGTITLGSSSGSPIAPSSDTQTFLKDSTKWHGTLTVPEINRSSTSSALSLPLYNWGNSQSAIVLNATTTSNNWLGGEDAVAAEVSLVGDFALDNGGSGQTYTFNNVTGSSGKNLKLYAWSGANNNNVTYAIGQFNNFAGTVQVINASTHKDGCALTLNVGNIVATAAYNTPLVAITTSITSSTGGDKSVTVNLANATLNGSTANLVYDTDGIYLAAATYGGENYATVQKAIDAAGDEHLADIVVADSSAEVPEGYALVGGTKVRKGGETIYWTSGTYWAASGGSAVFSTSLSDGEATTYAAGDAVVIPDTTKRWCGPVSDGAKITFDCGGTIDVEKTGDLGYAFKDAEITVESGTTVNFVQDGYAANPEVNGGSISGEGAITVASGAALVLSGEVELGVTPSGGTVNVANGAEVSCTGAATISSTLAGTGEISFATLPSSALTLGDWTGTVELPVLAANQAYQLNNYGKTGSTIRLNGLSAGWLAVATPITVNANLELAGDWNLAAMSTRVYNFATVSGTGNMSFATAENQPTSINIATLSGYSGAITNNTTATLTIGTLALDSGADVTAGAKLLSTGGTGSFSVTAVTVGGEAQTLNLSYRSDGVYVRGASVASYGNVEYDTIQGAIDAAVADGHTFAGVTILDPNATCPDGYYIDTKDNNVLKKYAAAAVTVGVTTTTQWFTTFQAAIDAAVADKTTYAVAYADGTATASVTGANVFMLMPNGYDVTVMCSVAGYGAYAQGQEIPEFAGVYLYSAVAAAATFTWTGAAEDGGLWATAGNWSSADGTVAAAPANSLYTVVLNTAATIALSGYVNIGTVKVGAAVTLNHVFGEDATLNASSIVLTAAGASLAKYDDQNSMTLAVVPTTTVANSYVKTTTSGGTTTYTVATQPTVSDVAFEYGADYASATVTATVSDTTLDYYISWAGGEPVRGSVSGSGSQVTFDVSGINHTTEYQSAAYSITAKDGETDVTTTGGSGTTVAADTTTWFSHNSSGLTGGAWTTPVNLSEPATVEDNTFTATAESTSSRVVLEFNVCFSSASDADVDGTAQAAIKIGEVESAATFMVLDQGGSWTPVFNDALTPDPAKTNKVVMTIDYGGSGSYGVAVDNYVMTNASGSASFPLAASKTSVQAIDFAGSGTLKSMKGDQVEGYMVKDNVGHWYATIQAATQAYNSANGPYTVLHDGTPPDGWKIDEATKALIKLAKGFFFMAY